MGHSLAMLLVAALTPAAQAAPYPAFMEICTAEGIVVLSAEQAADPGDGKAPENHGSGSGGLESCPVCSAFGQQSFNGPPAGLTLAIVCAAADRPIPTGTAPVRRQAVELPQSRAPPA